MAIEYRISYETNPGSLISYGIVSESLPRLFPDFSSEYTTFLAVICNTDDTGAEVYRVVPDEIVEEEDGEKALMTAETLEASPCIETIDFRGNSKQVVTNDLDKNLLIKLAHIRPELN